jgi:1,2-diacylglycerol 3-alpha-glucosyltransferase
MKVGIVSTWFERGAAYVSRQMEFTLSKTNEVFIYARGGEIFGKNDPVWDKENVTWGKRYPWYGPTQVSKKHFISWLTKNKIELVIFNEQHDFDVLKFCDEVGVVTGAYVDYYKQSTVKYFRLYDFLICNTQRHHSVFYWHQQAYYIPWGTQLDIFKPIRKNGDINPTQVTFFHSCGMNPHRKGTDLLVKAFYLTKIKSSRLILHTQVPLDNFLEKIKDEVSEIESDGRLEIINETVQAPGLYHMGDVYVYPSRLDGIGLTVAEALSCGLKVIVTDEPPMSEFVKDERAGKKVKVISHKKRSDGYYWKEVEVDVVELSQVMDDFALNWNQIKGETSEAREYAKEFLDWEDNFSGFCNMVDQIKKLPADTELMNDWYSYKNSLPIWEKIQSTFMYKSLRERFKKR